jgi:aldose 1-epimerase
MTTAVSNISVKNWGASKGKDVFLIRWENNDGSYVEFTNYGATIVSVVVPEGNGHLSPVVLGFDSLQAYLEDTCYIGATIGRFANRIAGARFKLDDQVILLEANDHPNTNHGGFSGFHSKVFDVDITPDAITFSLLSEDGDGGYPGNLALKVMYTWNENYELLINYQSVSDKKTVANFTNHSYFNLSSLAEDITNHTLLVNAETMLETDEHHIPTGKVVNCGDKGFKSEKIRDKLVEDKGVNNYYVIDPPGEDATLKHACTLQDDATQRRVDVLTTYPGLMVYTGDYLSSNFSGNRNFVFNRFGGVCLECQHYPDSPNHPDFPQVYLEAGEVCEEQILFKFS